MNSFLNAVTKGDARTENGAVVNSTTGNNVLDYFALAGTYRGRDFNDVSSDMGAIFGENQELALKTVFYNRMITRKPDGVSKVQRGQGQKDEFIKSLVWLEGNRSELLYKNLYVVPLVGCWGDLWYDSASTKVYNYINTDYVYPLVKQGMVDEKQRALIAKYLPKIRSSGKVKTERHVRMNRWAKGLCKFLGWDEKTYRKFKSDPRNTAHSFQRSMCGKDWKNLDFNSIAGKAMFNLINRRGKDGQNTISRHKLDKKMLEWLDKQPTVKFTGYVYELYRAARYSVSRSMIETHTLNKQFDGLIETAKADVDADLLNKGVLCAIDTSGSMSTRVGGTEVTALDVCLSMGIYFSELIQGHFKDNVVMFGDTSHFKKISGKFCDKADTIGRGSTAWGSTNFQSVIDEIVRVRKQNPHVPIEDYPEVLLVVSDMEHNPAVSGYWNDVQGSPAVINSNYEEAMRKLAAVGLPKMQVIWWNVNARNKHFPNKMDDEGVSLISGFDGSIVSRFLTGQEVVDKETGEVRKATPLEQMENALDQEVLNMLEV